MDLSTMISDLVAKAVAEALEGLAVEETPAKPEKATPKKGSVRKSAAPVTLEVSLKADRVTGGGRVKYDSGTVEDGPAKGVQVLVYLPANLARSQVSAALTLKGEGV